MLKTLKKRLFSSPAAFLTTLEQHEKSLRHAVKKTAVPKPTFGIAQAGLDRIDEDYADDDEYDEATTMPSTPPAGCSREPIDRRTGAAQADAGRGRNGRLASSTPRSEVLIAWLNEHIRPNGKWTDERVIIFTEYRATQNWLQGGPRRRRGSPGSDRLMTMYGGMDPKSREAVKAAFQAAPDSSPVRILLATDAASEGIDLQNHCSRLIHYEIPWNPNRWSSGTGASTGTARRLTTFRSSTSSARATRQRQQRRIQPCPSATWKPTWSS